MKIVQVIDDSKAVEHFFLPFIEMLSQMGHDVDIITSDPDGILQDNVIIIDNKISVFDVNIPKHFSLWQLFTTYNTMLELFQGMKPDVVHTHTPIISFLSRPAARKAGIPKTIYTAHGFAFHEEMNPFLYQYYLWLEKHQAKKYTDYLLTINEEDRKTAVEKHFLDEDRIINLNSVGIDTKVVFNPLRINPGKKKELYDEFQIDTESKVITYTGSLKKEKGLVELLEALYILKREMPRIKLILVGEVQKDDKEKKTKDLIWNTIDKYHLKKNVIFTGERQDVPEILSITDVFALPSHREGMPVSTLEALSMGVPVVGTDVRGLREQIENGKNGYLVPFKDPRALAQALGKSLNEFRAPCEKCRESCIQNYDQEDVLRKKKDLYRRIEKEITDEREEV